MEQKDNQIKKMMTNIVGAPDERIEEYELRVTELEDKCDKMERENYRLKQDGSYAAKKGKEESDKIVKDLSKQNAILRSKYDDALQKLENK